MKFSNYDNNTLEKYIGDMADVIWWLKGYMYNNEVSDLDHSHIQAIVQMRNVAKTELEGREENE